MIWTNSNVKAKSIGRNVIVSKLTKGNPSY
jgi:hypothetical protein